MSSCDVRSAIGSRTIADGDRTRGGERSSTASAGDAMKRVIAFGSIVLASLVLGAALFPKSVFYRNRRPTRLGKWTNDVMARWYSTRATPSLMSTLEVRRRRSGGVQRVPIVIADYE